MSSGELEEKGLQWLHVNIKTQKLENYSERGTSTRVSSTILKMLKAKVFLLVSHWNLFGNVQWNTEAQMQQNHFSIFKTFQGLLY